MLLCEELDKSFLGTGTAGGVALRPERPKNLLEIRLIWGSL